LSGDNQILMLRDPGYIDRLQLVDGGAVGAVLATWHQFLGKERKLNGRAT
jgi:hypothetical protein